MEEDEWGLICLREKVGELGYAMDENEYPGSEERSDGSGSEWYGSGEESDDSDEEYNSEDLVNIDVHDDDLFVKNIDVTAEFSGLSNVQVQSQQDNVQVLPQPCDEVNFSDEGNLVGSDGELEGQPQVEVEVDPQPDVITQVTQPEVEENEWKIPDEVLDDQWHQILIQAEDTFRGASLSTTVQVPVNVVGELMHDNVHIQQPITSDATQQLTRKRKGKSPMKSARKKMTVRKYRTRSTTTFISKFSGNDKEPITLD
nr:uncharacterized protein LOC109167506 [Ipomoea batatas]